MTKGPYINFVTVLGEGSMEVLTVHLLVMGKRVTKGENGSKNCNFINGRHLRLTKVNVATKISSS